MAARVLALAKKRKLSQNLLADFAGLGRGNLSEILSGRVSPTLRTLGKLAAALDVQVSELLSK
jgi:transcriptional regulator with XRE-family HTH domain